MPSDGGGPARGYEPQTRVRGEFQVDSYDYRWLDPARCDGSVCKLDDQTTTEQAPCPERYLMMQASGRLETLDGAIAAEFPTQAVNVRLPGQTDDLVVATAADLGQVTGRLRIDPGVSAPSVGRLDLSLQFEDDQHRGYGVLSVGVTPDWDHLSQDVASGIPSRFAYYSPLEGYWGDRRSGAPMVSAAVD
jgi:hypothetical protein